MLLRPGHLSLDELRAIHAGGQQDGGSTPLALPGIQASAAVVQAAADGDAAVYGVNTGFGKLASTRISAADLATLQLNLIRSHSVGVGEPLQPGGGAADAGAEGSKPGRGGFRACGPW